VSSRSYESILDHIADYLQFLSNAQSYWFMLNTRYDHGCHLANQFHLGSNDYKVLVIAAGLASYTRLRWHDERQHGNQPNKRHKRGAMLVAWREVAARRLNWQCQLHNGRGGSDNDNGVNGNDNNNVEMATIKEASTAGGERWDQRRNGHGNCTLPRVDDARQTH
jgi:hypothetical protein